MVNHHLGVSKNIGTPKWMVIMENPIKIDDLGYHYFWKHPFVKKKCLELHEPKHRSESHIQFLRCPSNHLFDQPATGRF